MTIHIVTHGGCPDGHTSAWLFSRFMEPTREPVVFHAQYDRINPPEDIFAGDKVIIADYSFPREALIELSQRCDSVTLLDHHKTAEADVQGLELRPNMEIKFDMNKSGAMLVWEYLDRPVDAENLVHYVEDYDLWNKVLLHTEEINAVVQSTPFTFEDWDALAETMADRPGDVVAQGTAIRRYQEKIMKAAIEDARKMTIGGHEVLVTQAPYALGSMIAGRMAEDDPDMAFGAYYISRDGETQFGLRSRSAGDDPGFDVSEVAKLYGGGGHHNASGFKVSWNGSDPLQALLALE